MPIRLVLRNLLAHPVRGLLTLLSIAFAVFLLCVLQAVLRGLDATIGQASTNRLWVQSAVSLFVELPLSYQSKIEAVEGVEYASKWQWFGGVYRDPKNFFAQFAIDPDTFFPSYPELEILEGSYDDFLASRTGCLIGLDLADQYGWKLGDTIPLIGTIFPRQDGQPWEFQVKGIYRSKTTALDQKTLFFQFEYLREAVESGASGGPEGSGVYMVRVAPGRDPTPVMATIDGLFENGPQRVQTTTEAEFNRQFISMLGNVPVLLQSIGGAVLFAIFFAVLNTMLMAARERTRDVGIMKSLGFGDGAVAATLFAEAFTICVAGGLLGLLLAKGIERPFQSALGSQLPGFEISQQSVLFGMAIALGLGFLATLLPALALRRKGPVEALRAGA